MEDEYVKVTGTEINEKCSYPATPMTAIASSTRSDSPTFLSQSPALSGNYCFNDPTMEPN